MPRNQLSSFDKKLRKIISANLKKYTSHLTQGQLSDMTNIPASTLSGYFAMRSTPNAGNVQKIADALHIDKSDIDPRFSKNISKDNTDLPPLNKRDERDIAKQLEKMMANLDSETGLSFYGKPLDEDNREILRTSLENTLRLSKQLAKKKFTPKKYRK